MFRFKRISSFTAVLAFALFALLLIAPEFIFLLFGISGSESASFISRRAAMLFLGISVLTWFGRDAGHSDLRQAVCIGLAGSMCGLAVLGSAEFARGYAGAGIWPAIITEMALGVAYAKIWFEHRNA